MSKVGHGKCLNRAEPKIYSNLLKILEIEGLSWPQAALGPHACSSRSARSRNCSNLTGGMGADLQKSISWRDDPN